MNELGEIEIRISGKIGNDTLNPNNFDIREIISILENMDGLLFPTEKNRPIIAYEMREGSVRNLFKTTIHSIITFNATLGLISSTKSIDYLNAKTAKAIESFQEYVRKKDFSIEIKTSIENSNSILIDRHSHFFRTENIWTEAEFYFYGKITNAGGKDKANIHLLTSEYGTLKIKTPISFLESQEGNILYKTLGVRAKGKQNIQNGEIDTSELEILSFLDYSPTYDENYLKSLRNKAKESWAGIDKSQWLNEIRGYGM